MLNAYSIIIGLFIFGGLFSSVWGWKNMAQGRSSREWPQVKGEIISVNATDDADDLLPHIEYRYTVNQETYTNPLEFPAGTSPSQELSNQYLARYPQGTSVKVAYNPDNPATATLEPGQVQGDWLVFAMGIVSVLLGLVLLLFGW